MKVLPIQYKTQTFECLLDEEDYLYFSTFPWYYRKGYAGRSRRSTDPKGNHWVHLHHEVLFRKGISIPSGMCVDHINRNKMDNRKENLRVVTRSENSKNVSFAETQRRKLIVKKATEIAATKPRTSLQQTTCSRNVANVNKTGKNRHVGKDNYASKQVIDIKTKEVYINVREAAQKLGLKYSTLKSRLNGSLHNTTNLVHLDKYHSKVPDEE